MILFIFAASSDNMILFSENLQGNLMEVLTAHISTKVYPRNLKHSYKYSNYTMNIYKSLYSSNYALIEQHIQVYMYINFFETPIQFINKINGSWFSKII